MRCEQVRRELHEAPRPEEPLSPELEEHLAACSSCRGVQLELRALRRGLTGLEPEALPEGFELALRRRLERASGQRRSAPPRRRNLMPYALAASVLLAVAAVTALVLSYRGDGGGESGSEVGQHHSLALSIRSAEEHPEALFDLRLPPGVSLTRAASASLGAGTTVKWRSRLRVGRNELELPLVARSPGPVRIEVRVGPRSLATTVQIGAQAAMDRRRVLVAFELRGRQDLTEVLR